jgi:hypothetical protein
MVAATSGQPAMRPGDPIDVYADGWFITRGIIAARTMWFDLEHYSYVLHIEIDRTPLWFWIDQCP